MVYKGLCRLVKLTVLLTILAYSSTTDAVVEIHCAENRTVPITHPENITLNCTAEEDLIAFWHVGTNQYPSDLPLENTTSLQSDTIGGFEAQGIYVQDSPLQNHTRLIISERVRQSISLIQVHCTAFNIRSLGSDRTGFCYVITYGAPDPPQNLALQPSSTSPSLPPVLSWQRPSNIPESVPLTYHLQIRNNDLKIEVFNGVFSRTDVQLNQLPEDANCSLFEFSVTASNDVGNSSTTSIMETVPITPDVGPVNSSLRVLSVDVSGGSPSVSLAFDEAQVCSERYSVTDYTVVSSDGSISVSINASSDVSNYTVILDSANAPNLTQGFGYDISVIACNNLTCRESKSIEVFTTDVQNPRVRYLNNSVNLTCEFAEGSTAVGCIFSFTGVTEQEIFVVNRSGDSLMATSCAMASAFANNTDYTWSAFDDIGGVPITVQLIAVNSHDADNFECLPFLSGPPNPIPGIVGGVVGGIMLLLIITVIPILIVWCVHPKKKSLSPLHKAARGGDLHEVQSLVDKGVNVNIKDTHSGRTPLHMAVRGGRKDIVSYLVDKGAKISIKDVFRVTPMYVAAKGGYLNIVEYLIEQKADVNVKDHEGKTPLHMAAEGGHLDTVKTLVNAGANISTQDKCGMVPLHLAAERGRLDIVKYFVCQKADINIKDNNGRIPLDIANKRGHMEIAEYLIGDVGSTRV